MPNQTNVLLKKDTFYRAVPLILTTIFFFMVAPIPQLEIFQALSPLLIFTGTILLIDGIVLIFEFFRNLPDAGNHLGAKSGAYMFLVMGMIVLAFGVGSITGFYDPFANVQSNYEITLLLTAVLGLTAMVQYVSVHPFLFTKKKSFAHMARSG